MPDAPEPGFDLSSTTTSAPEPAPRSRSSLARWYAVESPWIPAPTTTYWARCMFIAPSAIALRAVLHTLAQCQAAGRIPRPARGSCYVSDGLAGTALGAPDAGAGAARKPLPPPDPRTPTRSQSPLSTPATCSSSDSLSPVVRSRIGARIAAVRTP